MGWSASALRISLLPLVVSAGCALALSPFQRTAAEAGSTLGAAALTLEYAHTGRLTSAYLRSSFVNFRGELAGLESRLSSLAGAPDTQRVQRLLALYRPAAEAMQRPCLDDTCDWQAQVGALQQASQALLKASGE